MKLRELIAGQPIPIARGYKGFEYKPIGSEMADQILSLFSSYIKPVENPYKRNDGLHTDKEEGFESCRNELLKGLEGK